MKKIRNTAEVMDYFVSQIEKFSEKCMETAKKQMEAMKRVNDPKIALFGEEAYLDRLYRNLFYNDNKSAYVHYSDHTIQLYIGNRDDPPGDTIEVDKWQFVGSVDEDELMDAMVDNIIDKYNFYLKHTAN